MQIGDSFAAAQSMVANMGNFASAAADGEFEVSATGGDALIKAIDDFQHWIDTKSNEAGLLEQRRKLGGGNGAQAMDPFLQAVASDSQGFVTQLRALGESLDQARAGIKTAMENYRRTDDANRESLKGTQT